MFEYDGCWDNEESEMCRYRHGIESRCILFDNVTHCDGLDEWCPYYEILEPEEKDG